MSNNKRKKIIRNAAKQIIHRKGLRNLSIAEIAKSTGVKESLIYYYFQDKEDLIFTIASQETKEVLDKLMEQLQGIVDPISKLSKMIWYHLYYHDIHREYARIILFECRSNRSFYRHEAYNFIRKYAGVMLAILENGVQEHVFRKDINTRLVRDMIFGGLDWEILSCLAAKEIDKTTPDFDAIMGLILPMILIDPRQPYTELNKSSRIRWAAERVLAEKGYNQATISQVAKLAKVSEGTIYEYFKNKEDLLFSIAEERFREHLSALDEIFKIKAPLRKLQHIIRYHFNLYLTQPDFLRVFLPNIQLNHNFYSSNAYKIFLEYTNILYPILEEGKEAGVFRKDTDNRVFKNFFLGAFCHMALRWMILETEAKSYDKIHEIDEIVLLFSRALTNI